jgi:pimeloyl-ACP methyl ester carboxylesterase
MATGSPMADIAEQHADALLTEFGGPVDVLGMSSGGSVALQLAADRRDAVRRLVVAAAGYRLGPATKQAQLRYVEAAAAGRRGAHHLAPLKVGSRVGAAPRAEDAFDLGSRLGDISAPTLVVCGERDRVAADVTRFLRQP